MDTVMIPSDLAHRSSSVSAIAQPVPQDDLAFFHALWFWIPTGLGLWAAIIWTILRLV